MLVREWPDFGPIDPEPSENCAVLVERRGEDGPRTPELNKRSRARITGNARCLDAQICDVFKGLPPRCLFKEAGWAGLKRFLYKLRQRSREVAGRDPAKTLAIPNEEDTK